MPASQPADRLPPQSWPRSPIWRLLAYAVPVLLAAGLAVFPLHNDDAGFHIATGRVVLATGHVPVQNPFSYAQDGATWIQHQWLPAVAMAWIVDHWGVPALILIKAMLVGMAFALMAGALWRSRLAAPWAMLLLTIAVTASAFRFYERPYLASILALAGTTWALQAWRDTGDRRAGVVAVVLPVVAVHLHAGGLDSVLLWCAFAAGAVLQPYLTPLPHAVSRRRVLGALALMLALLVGSLALLAPSGLRLLTLPFSFAGNPYWHEHLAEFRPLAADPSAALQWLVVLVGLLGLLLAVRARRAFETLALAGFTLLAMRHVRMVWPMAVVAVPLTGNLLAGALTPRLLRVQALGLASVLALVIAASGALDQHAHFGLGLGADGVDHQRHPLALLDLAARLPERAFVSDGLAGTWLWREYGLADAAHPDGTHRVLVHNCLECYQESTYIDVYQRIRYAQGDWREQVERLGIRTFVLKHTTPGERRFQQGKPNLRQLLRNDSAFVLVDFDDTASVYSERAGLPPGQPTLADFPVDPDTGRPNPGTPPGRLRAALQAHSTRHPDGVRALDMWARLELASGRDVEAGAIVAEMLRRQPRSFAAAELLARVTR